MHTVLSSFRGPSLDATPGLLQKLSAERVIPVPVWRLETRLPQLVPDLARRRIHLKLDTQGFDLEALAGLGPIPIVSLQLELPFVRIYDGVPTAAEHFRILDGLGYDLVGVYPVVRHKTGVLVEADGVFLRR